MTRMHFEAIAGIIAQTFQPAKVVATAEEQRVLERVQAILVDNLAVRLSYFNGNFNARKFIDACYKD